MSAPTEYTRIVLNKVPTGNLDPNVFKLEKRSFTSLEDTLGPKDILVKGQYISLDPSVRLWMNGWDGYPGPPPVLGNPDAGLGYLHGRESWGRSDISSSWRYCHRTIW